VINVFLSNIAQNGVDFSFLSLTCFKKHYFLFHLLLLLSCYFFKTHNPNSSFKLVLYFIILLYFISFHLWFVFFKMVSILIFFHEYSYESFILNNHQSN